MVLTAPLLIFFHPLHALWGRLGHSPQSTDYCQNTCAAIMQHFPNKVPAPAWYVWQIFTWWGHGGVGALSAAAFSPWRPRGERGPFLWSVGLLSEVGSLDLVSFLSSPLLPPTMVQCRNGAAIFRLHSEEFLSRRSIPDAPQVRCEGCRPQCGLSRGVSTKADWRASRCQEPGPSWLIPPCSRIWSVPCGPTAGVFEKDHGPRSLLVPWPK